MIIGWHDITLDFSSGNEVVRYNSTLGIGEVVEQDTVAHQQIMAIVPVAASGGTSFKGWFNGQDPTHDGFLGFLTGGVVPGFTGPSDVREMMGRGPVSIAAGGHVTVYFAIVGGDNRTAFNGECGGDEGGDRGDSNRSDHRPSFAQATQIGEAECFIKQRGTLGQLFRRLDDIAPHVGFGVHLGDGQAPRLRIEVRAKAGDSGATTG